jgi:catechol 2,3-dioxygenase-like lactoylglutathione lyase family enzyme
MGCPQLGLPRFRTSAWMVAGLAIAPDDTPSSFARQWKLAWGREVCCTSCTDGMVADMAAMVQKISAVTFRVANMTESVRFYRDVLGMEIIYGGEGQWFSSLRTQDATYPILNLEQGEPATRWGRLIFHVEDVDACWTYLRGKGFHPENPRDASWGERYFHMPDPDGHELSFARPLLALFQQPDELIGGEEREPPRWGGCMT